MAKKTEAAGDRLEQLGSAEGPKDVPFADGVEQIVVITRGTIGQVVYEPGHVLAEVRLTTGVTLAQLCAAIRHGKAGA